MKNASGYSGPFVVKFNNEGQAHTPKYMNTQH